MKSLVISLGLILSAQAGEIATLKDQHLKVQELKVSFEKLRTEQQQSVIRVFKLKSDQEKEILSSAPLSVDQFNALAGRKSAPKEEMAAAEWDKKFAEKRAAIERKKIAQVPLPILWTVPPRPGGPGNQEAWQRMKAIAMEKNQMLQKRYEAEIHKRGMEAKEEAKKQMGPRPTAEAIKPNTSPFIASEATAADWKKVEDSLNQIMPEGWKASTRSEGKHRIVVVDTSANE